MRCEEIREMLPGHIQDGDPSLLVRRHLAHCSSCSAEAGRYALLRTGLSGLSTETSQPSAELFRTLVDIPASLSRQEQVLTHITRNKKAYAGGAAILVGAVGAAVWRSRTRRPLSA